MATKRDEARCEGCDAKRSKAKQSNGLTFLPGGVHRGLLLWISCELLACRCEARACQGQGSRPFRPLHACISNTDLRDPRHLRSSPPFPSLAPSGTQRRETEMRGSDIAQEPSPPSPYFNPATSDSTSPSPITKTRRPSCSCSISLGVLDQRRTA
jgi:hypothetical protein